jgi:hypothetical protein
MRRLAALTFAALFLFAVAFLNGQTQTTQPQSSNSDNSSKTENSQPPEKAQSSSKSESLRDHENPFDQFQQFSALVSGGPLHWDKIKIYRSGNLFRADHDYEKEVRITDLSKKAGWAMRHWENRPEKCGPTDKMDAATYPFFAYTGNDYKVERVPQSEPAEKDTIDGHPTDIEKYTVTQTSDGTLVAKVKLWRAEDLKAFPVRMEIDPPRTKLFYLYYTNVSLERPDPKLFVVPAKCLKAPEAAATPSRKSKPLKPTTPNQ